MKIDQDNITDSVYKISELCLQMESKKDYETASQVLMSLSILKLIIGEKFDELPSFTRWIKMADKIVAEHDKEIQ